MNNRDLMWSGHPFEKLWRITFYKKMDGRADERPSFVYGYRAVCT